MSERVNVLIMMYIYNTISLLNNKIKIYHFGLHIIRHLTRHFICIISFHSHCNPCEGRCVDVLISMFYLYNSKEKVNTFPRVTQLAEGRARFNLRYTRPKSKVSFLESP